MNYANHYKIGFKYFLCLLIFFITFVSYTKMSAKYYQNNKERLRKNAPKNFKSISKQKKEKCNNMALNNTKIYPKMKDKNLLSIEKNKNWEKMPYCNYKKLLFWKLMT